MGRRTSAGRAAARTPEMGVIAQAWPSPLLHGLIQQAAEAIVVRDAGTGVVLHANDAARSLLGDTDSPPGPESSPVASLHLHPDGRIIPITGVRTPVEVDGHSFAVEVVQEAGRSEGGKSAWARVAPHVLTAVLDTAPVGIAVLDRELRPLRVNRLLAAMRCTPAAHAGGLTFEQLLPGLLEHTPDVAQRVVERGEPLAGVQLSHGTGEAARHQSVSLYPVRVAGGAVGGALCFVVEETERTLARHSLRWKTTLLRAMTDASPVAFYALDRDTDAVLYADERLAAVLGVPELAGDLIRGALLPAGLLEACRPLLVEPDALSAALRPPAVPEQPGDTDTEIAFRDGRTVHLFATVLHDELGDVFGRLYAFQDVTEQRRSARALERAEAHLRTVVGSAPIMLTAVDRDGRCTLAEGRGLALLGLRPDELLGADAFTTLGRYPEITAQVRRALAGEETMAVNVVRGRTFETRFLPLRDDGGALLGAMMVSIDVTDRAEAEGALRRSEARFRSMIQNVSDIVTLLEPDGRIRYESPALERVLGYTPEQVEGAYLGDYLHPDDREAGSAALATALATPGGRAQVQARLRHADGSWRHLECAITNLLDDPEVAGVVVNSRDISERKAFEAELEQRAFYDELTGLPNRALFMDRLTHALARSARHGGDVAVMFLDLDRFKMINDSLGHEAGDALLIDVAARLARAVRASDTVSRFGGDEFTILLEGVASPEEATDLAGRMVAGLQHPFTLGERDMFVTASIGIAFSGPGRDDPAGLLRDADVALYQAKNDGRARYAVFDAVRAPRSVERLELETDLRRALARGEMRVVYQPELDLATGRLAGVEALARWEHPRRGAVPPSTFIPLAEESGLIFDIGRWVMEQACLQARAWARMRPFGPPLTVAINLSAREFSSPDLVEWVRRVLRDTEIEPDAVRLEITESTVVRDAEATVETLLALKGLGVRLAIDDFGTGYSSLSYLTRFAVDTLKVDRSFVTGVGHDPRTLSVVRAVTALAHALGMDVTAEGIETAEQLKVVRSVKCDRGQGYYFFRPMDSGALTQLLMSGLR